ncbi:MAG TPA: ACT domain-containing protein [Planctomycetaceae bacterium]|nr:ACT domain-containing protein [Planctomycetaceae bacterium]HIQ22059.1 ACT domain-containing protein [Planctomycetota bacterium]
MKIPQISVFLENKPGRLITPCRLLTEAGINILTLSLADTEQFGILRLIVRQWQRARDLLESSGLAVTVTEVLAIEVRDQPGGLLELLEVFQRAGINVEYMYAFTARLGNRAVLVFRFDDLDRAITALTRAGINPVSPVTLYDSLEEA